MRCKYEGMGCYLGYFNGKHQYGIPYFWSEAKSYKNSHLYKGEDQLIWDSIVFATVIEKFIGMCVPPIYVPLVNGDVFRIFCVQKSGYKFDVVDMCSYSFRSKDGQAIWCSIFNYANSIAQLIIDVKEKLKAKLKANAEPRTDTVKPIEENSMNSTWEDLGREGNSEILDYGVNSGSVDI